MGRAAWPMGRNASGGSGAVGPGSDEGDAVAGWTVAGRGKIDEMLRGNEGPLCASREIVHHSLRHGAWSGTKITSVSPGENAG
jgi:hypothetical protein